MHKPRTLCTALALLACVGFPNRALAQDADVVIEWNRILQTTIGAPGANPPTVFQTRPYVYMHVAMFDALNSIDRVYHPYAIQLDGAGASREAAAAQAAHDVLVAVLPTQSATYDAALTATLSRLPADAARQGASIGAAAARALLELRRDDGWNRVPGAYVLPDLPGYWKPTPPQNSPATFTHYAEVVPFLFASARQFLVAPPPSLTSELYAADFNEVKALGSATSTVRTAEQTSIALRWAGVGSGTGLFAVWNNVVRDVSRRFGWTGLDTARAFALLNMAMHDGLIVSFTGKFLYGLWRPVTAIREADRDGNPATDADPSWLPLLATPPYPTYRGNMTCIAGAASRTLARVFGRNDIPFSVTWGGTGTNLDITRPYNGFRELADEEQRSRVYGGIHFEFDQLASMGVCTLLADYAVDNHLRARFLTQ
jgi:hypothetical protein